MNISTLGPRNTNSEFASRFYLRDKIKTGNITLCNTPEEAIEELIDGTVEKCILCVVYPRLNEIVFENLDKIYISEVFHYNTDNMVTAKHPNNTEIKSVCSHPAPKSLLKDFLTDVHLVNSNSTAARLVSNLQYDACVTTKEAAAEYQLEIIKDYGPVPMGWAVFEARHD